MPWFIKKLPARVEIVRGERLEVNCIVGESDIHVTRTAQYARERLIRQEAKATIQRGRYMSDIVSDNVNIVVVTKLIINILLTWCK